MQQIIGVNALYIYYEIVHEVRLGGAMVTASD